MSYPWSFVNGTVFSLIKLASFGAHMNKYNGNIGLLVSLERQQ